MTEKFYNKGSHHDFPSVMRRCHDDRGGIFLWRTGDHEDVSAIWMVWCEEGVTGVKF